MEAGRFVCGFVGGSGVGLLRTTGRSFASSSVWRRPAGFRRALSPVVAVVAPPAKTPSVTRDPETDLWAQRPPFSLQDVRAAIPAELWKKDTFTSVAYMLRDVGIVAALAYSAITLNHPLMWLFYYIAQGTMMWALFVVGHDCGHRSFSPNNLINDIFGHITHGSILVPYHGWRISHRTHHANHGHVENDESWYPVAKSEYEELDPLVKMVRFELPLFMIAYQLYLFRRSPGKEGSHFDPNCDLFKPHERGMVLQSTAACLTTVAILTGLAFKFGFLFVLNTYLIPHTVFCAWLVTVTYLHHTDSQLPWYRDGEWTYLRGGLTTNDKDYGIINHIHHDIGTHVVHHLFPQMPHYNLVKATEAIKPVLGDYYREPKRGGPIPFHLVRDLFRSLRECRWVKEDGAVVYYEGK